MKFCDQDNKIYGQFLHFGRRNGTPVPDYREKEALLIDAGFPGCHIRDTVSAVTDLPVSVIMTHGDMDHAGGLPEFGKCRLHKADWKLVSGDIEMEPLAEGDVFQCGGTVWRP